MANVFFKTVILTGLYWKGWHARVRGQDEEEPGLCWRKTKVPNEGVAWRDAGGPGWEGKTELVVAEVDADMNVSRSLLSGCEELL